MGNLVSNDQIVAIAAENASVDTVWFWYVIEVKQVDHSNSNSRLDYGYNGPKLQPYLLCNYLEKLNDNKKVFYIKEIKKRFHLQRKYCVSTR